MISESMVINYFEWTTLWTTRGGVCIYYKESLVVKITLITLEDILLLFIYPQVKHFLSGFEQLLINTEDLKPNFTVLLGDYNVHSKSWWASNANTPECMQLDALTSSYSLQQLVNEPTHILPNSSSCTDLIFTDQPRVVVNSGTHPSSHANCRHQITYCKLNLKIKYPPPYQHLVWIFKKADITSIRKVIHTVNWEFLYFNNSVHGQILFSNKILFFPFIFQTGSWPLMTKIPLGWLRE